MEKSDQQKQINIIRILEDWQLRFILRKPISSFDLQINPITQMSFIEKKKKKDNVDIHSFHINL